MTPSEYEIASARKRLKAAKAIEQLSDVQLNGLTMLVNNLIGAKDVKDGLIAFTEYAPFSYVEILADDFIPQIVEADKAYTANPAAAPKPLLATG